MDICTLNAAIIRLQSDIDSAPDLFTYESCQDAYDDGFRDGLIEARDCLQALLDAEDAARAAATGL